MQSAIRSALWSEMERDDSIVVFGQEVGEHGGRIGITKGFQKHFSDSRVIDMPVSEELFVGIAIGMAQMGLRPVVEFSHGNLLTLAAADIFRAAFWEQISGEKPLPIVIRARYSDFVGMELSRMPLNICLPYGINVVVLSDPQKAGDLLMEALHSDRVTIIFEHTKLYKKTAALTVKEAIVSFGKAQVVCSGDDITILTYGKLCEETVEATQMLLKKGISAEVIDLVSLSPLDRLTIVASAQKTNTVLVVGEEYAPHSVLYPQLFMLIKNEVPESRVAYVGLKTPLVPFGPLHEAVFPQREDIISEAEVLVS